MINLTQILEHLPSERISDLERITQKILDTQHAHIILLFGSYARGDYKVKRGIEQGKKSDFDILVVTEDSTSKRKVVGELRDAFADSEIVVQTLVVTINTVNQALEENQYFYSDIKKEGIELYNSGRFDFATFTGLSATQRREIAEADFSEWITEAKESLIDSQNNIERANYKRASFHFQQSIEMCYTAIEMVFSHYNTHEHNLIALRDRTVKYHVRLKDVFHYKDEEQKKLFDQLNYAYIGGRYKNEKEFPIDMDKIEFWKQETEMFLKLTEEICLERIEGFRQLE
ncbi:MAG: HEPN domain-containing protein [Putridiphycobacter sp.]|nr:HEPN domain-containing protein [Putridiphycobacter sp.]